MKEKSNQSAKNGQRHATYLANKHLTNKRPEKRLRNILAKHAGRSSSGRVSVRHQGGRQKRYWREIDFKRDKRGIPARVVTLEYDPNRGVEIALVYYADGEKRYILAPEGLKIGDEVLAGEKAILKVGNALPLKKIPVGMPIHNLELTPGKGGQIIRGAGTSALIQAKEKNFAVVKLPSKEERKIEIGCYATIGQLSRSELKNINLGKAGRKRLMGWRPTVRGVAQHPNSHPHGGGEGRSGIGMPSPKTPWGKRTLGKITRNRRKYSNQYIIKGRNNITI